VLSADPYHPLSGPLMIPGRPDWPTFERIEEVTLGDRGKKWRVVRYYKDQAGDIVDDYSQFSCCNGTYTWWEESHTLVLRGSPRPLYSIANRLLDPSWLARFSFGPLQAGTHDFRRTWRLYIETATQHLWFIEVDAELGFLHQLTEMREGVLQEQITMDGVIVGDELAREMFDFMPSLNQSVTDWSDWVRRHHRVRPSTFARSRLGR
jgi:hypothetical protein